MVQMNERKQLGLHLDIVDKIFVYLIVDII